jgi:hypothetical protein
MSHGQFGFFDREQQLAKIYQLNNFLPKLNALIPWEMFRPTFQTVREKEHHGPGGRPPFDVVLMFKILILKSIYNLADVRCRIEHVFGAMKSRCRDEVLRSIGMARAKFWIGLRNLTYNMGRFVSLKCPKPRRVR